MSSSSISSSFDSSSVVSTLSDSTSIASSSTSTSSSAAATSAGSGCVTCTSDTSCPECDDDEYCVMTLLTCTECPRTYCAKRSSSALQSNSTTTATSSSSHSSSSKVGGIVGGVVGGVAVIVGILLLYVYLKYWSKNKTRTRNLLVAHEEYGDSGDIDDTTSHTHAGHSQGSQPMLEPRNRSSAATAITKASNILPIAYIPGVTAGKRGFAKPQPPLPHHLLRSGDTRSHITLGSSILGEDDEDDDEDDGQEGKDEDPASATIASNTSEKHSQGPTGDALTTAIRARPRLVQISEEEDGAEDDDDDQDSPTEHDEPTEKEHVVTTLEALSSGDNNNDQSLILTGRSADTSGNDIDEDDDDDDDDDDGSFILNVEVPENLRHIANNPHSENNEGSGSPFEDKFYI